MKASPYHQKSGQDAEKSLAVAIQRYKSAHWGNQHKKILTIDDPLFPKAATQMGELQSLFVRTPSGLIEIEFTGKRNHLAFDPTHPNQLIYLVIGKDTKEALRQGMKKLSHLQSSIPEIARVAGGRHGKGAYPEISAVPIGKITHVIYFTDKLGDGPSNYIHEFGEDNMKDIRPILACDSSGRLWCCGGNYTVPDAGIMD